MDILLASLFLFGISLLLYYLKYFYECSKLKGIDGPAVLPFLGNALSMRSPTKVISALLNYHKEFKGKTFRIFIGTQPLVFICEAKHVERILSSSIELKKAKPYEFLWNWLGTGLLTSCGSKWARHRKIITPAFHFKILEDFVDVFNSCSERFVAKLSKLEKSPFNIYPYITKCTLDVMCETSLGTSVHAQEDSNSEYVNAVDRMGMLLIKKTFSPLLQNPTLYQYLPQAEKERRNLDILHGYTKKIIKARRLDLFSNGTSSSKSVDEFGIKKRKAFLDLLLEYQVQDPTFTDENIREEVDTLTFEGHDTTGSTIAFAIYSLAMHPAVQEKSFNEVKNILADDTTRRFTFNDLQEMKYLEMVIKETLRMYPAVPFYGRELTNDFDMGGIILPKGVMILIYAIGIHRNPLYFKDPETFNPERFSPENTLGRSPYCFVPFSAGPRNCIGQKFAMLQIKTTLANLMRRFVINPEDINKKVQLRNDMVLKSETGICVRLENRNV